MKLFRPAVLIPALLLGLAATAQACPGCKEALASSEGAQGDIVSGYFWSILFMMSMPFVILGTFGIVVYRAMKKAQAAENRSAASAKQSQLSPSAVSTAPRAQQREPVEV